MKRLILILLILGLVSGCNNPFSVRMNEDYYPLGVGNKWVYQVNGDPSREVNIEVIHQDTLWTVSINGDITYIERIPGEVNILNEIISTHLGERVSFGKIRETYLKLPFIKDDSWLQEFNLKTVYSGDTLDKTLFISVDSVIITSLSVPSGIYDEVYRLRRIRIEDEDSLISYEWYAPNIGLIRKEILNDSIIWELTEYNLNGE